MVKLSLLLEMSQRLVKMAFFCLVYLQTILPPSPAPYKCQVARTGEEYSAQTVHHHSRQEYPLHLQTNNLYPTPNYQE